MPARLTKLPELSAFMIEDSMFHTIASNIDAASDELRAERYQDTEEFQEMYRPYDVQGNTLVLRVEGTLLNGLDITIGGFLTGYSYLEDMLDMAVLDDNVTSIALVINSGGGTVRGLAEMSAALKRASAVMDVVAFVDDDAYSAAYFIASFADTIVARESSGVGSIGAKITHVSYEGMMKKQGIAVTSIVSGSKKEGISSYKDLSTEDVEAMQKVVDAAAAMFISQVSENRDVTEEDLVSMEAGVFDGKEGLENGLVDTVTPNIKSALAAFIEEDTMMATKPQEAPAAKTTEAPVDTQALVAEAVTAERTRVSAISAHKQTQLQPALSAKLIEHGIEASVAIDIFDAIVATETKAEVKVVDAEVGAEAKTKAANDFETDMANENPEIEPKLTSKDSKAVATKVTDPIDDSADILASLGITT